MNQRINNLNKSEIPTDDKDFYIFKDYQVTTDTKVDVYFRDMEYHLIERIKKHKCVVGCVAWLTNEPILKALANLKFVSIVVQKEDFLRPDSNNGYGSGQKLRNLYSQIPSLIDLICQEYLATCLFVITPLIFSLLDVLEFIKVTRELYTQECTINFWFFANKFLVVKIENRT